MAVQKVLETTLIAATRWLAWLGVLGLVLATVVPARERPISNLPHDVEHLLAFAAVGGLVAFSFKTKPLLLFLLAIGFVACLEASQIPLPTRHARLEDLLFNAAGAWIGLAAGLGVRSMLIRTRTLKAS